MVTIVISSIAGLADLRIFRGGNHPHAFRNHFFAGLRNAGMPEE